MSFLLMSRLLTGKCITSTLSRLNSHSACLAHSFASNDGLSDQIFSQNARQSTLSRHTVFSSTSVRGIFNEKSLGMESFDRLRRDKDKIFDSGKERYIERVRKYIQDGQTQSVVKEDLVNIIGLAETEQHLDLIEETLTSPSMKDFLVNGPWGSVLMRLYYRMNEIDRACRNIKDVDRFGKFFIQYATFRILLTMLYKAGKYEQLIEIYDVACKELTSNSSAKQRQLDVLAMAALAKINTPESFSTAEKIYSKSISLNSKHLLSRLDSLFVYLAINMNDPTLALNHLAGTRLINVVFFPTFSLKILALAKLNRYEDTVLSLREAIQKVKPGRKVLPQQLANMLREKKNEIENDNICQELMDILVELKENNLLEEQTLEEIIFNEIELLPPQQLQLSHQVQTSSGQNRFTYDRGFRPRASSYENNNRWRRGQGEENFQDGRYQRNGRMSSDFPERRFKPRGRDRPLNYLPIDDDDEDSYSRQQH